MRIAMRKDDDVSGLQFDGWLISQLYERSPVDEEMVEHHMQRARREQVREFVRRRRGEAPRRREFSAEEDSAVQFDSAQDLGECIHRSALDCLLSFLATLQKNPLRQAARANHGDARAWPSRSTYC